MIAMSYRGVFHVKHSMRLRRVSRETCSFPHFLSLVLSMTNRSRFLSVLSSGASAYGLTLDSASLSFFFSYAELVSSWNTRLNLVSFRDMNRFVEYHLLDSLKISTCIDLSSCGKVMDYGSGAGLPGIPIALAFPHVEVTLVESVGKKCRFLMEASSAIPIRNVTVLHARVEELPSSLDSLYGCVVTRATVRLIRFVRTASRFIGPSSSLVSIKGDHIDDELRELEKKIDSRVFHITVAHPVPVTNVRTGSVVVISQT
jgi:16S rRNA (guanine527-N7)-methyltransferase